MNRLKCEREVVVFGCSSGLKSQGRFKENCKRPFTVLCLSRRKEATLKHTHSCRRYMPPQPILQSLVSCQWHKGLQSLRHSGCLRVNKVLSEFVLVSNHRGCMLILSLRQTSCSSVWLWLSVSLCQE